jgi:hypothetical protein
MCGWRRKPRPSGLRFENLDDGPGNLGEFKERPKQRTIEWFALSMCRRRNRADPEDA